MNTQKKALTTNLLITMIIGLATAVVITLIVVSISNGDLPSFITMIFG